MTTVDTVTPRMLQILFAVDEPASLQGVVDAFARARPDWGIQVVDNGAAALDAARTGRVDVVVCDRDLAGRGGLQLLRTFRELSPATARIVLSADLDARSVFEDTRVAHQVSQTPCHAVRLREAIERIEASRAALGDDTIRGVIGDIDGLPTPGPVHERLVAELQGDFSLASLEEIVTTDVALTAELLRTVNSAFFGLARRLERVGDAITFLGIDVMTAIVAAQSLYRPDPSSPVDVASLNEHSRGVAALAALAHGGSANSPHMKTQAFAAGLLHDVGVLALAKRPTSEPDAVRALIGEHDLVSERLHFGADRYSIAAYLLGLWNFDAEISAAIASLARPADTVERTGLAWTVRIAHEAVGSGRITVSDALGADPIDLKIELADIVDELDRRGTVARVSPHAA